MPKAAICHFGNRLCFLDHLIPYCHLFDIPLVTDDPLLVTMAEYFYPPIKIIETKNPKKILDKYELLIYAQPYKSFPVGIEFPNFFYSSQVKTCCTLHGNSEKYQDTFWFERLVDEDIVLIYGRMLVDILKKKGIYQRLRCPIIMGNVRYQFYKEHFEFFTKKVSSFIFRKVKNKKRLLWAPTWNAEEGSSFFTLASKILSLLPSEFQMIIKLHPLMLTLYEKEVEKLQADFCNKKEVMIITSMPLIYPLLEQIDLFLGDSSSVSYDFLLFNRPLFFLSENCSASLLHSSGRQIALDEVDKIFHIMSEEENPKYAKIREENYSIAFDSEMTNTELKKKMSAYGSY